eukprot:286266-Rhodomonas_salina.1
MHSVSSGESLVNLGQTHLFSLPVNGAELTSGSWHCGLSQGGLADPADARQILPARKLGGALRSLSSAHVELREAGLEVIAILIADVHMTTSDENQFVELVGTEASRDQAFRALASDTLSVKTGSEQ